MASVLGGLTGLFGRVPERLSLLPDQFQFLAVLLAERSGILGEPAKPFCLLPG